MTIADGVSWQGRSLGVGAPGRAPDSRPLRTLADRLLY